MRFAEALVFLHGPPYRIRRACWPAYAEIWRRDDTIQEESHSFRMNDILASDWEPVDDLARRHSEARDKAIGNLRESVAACVRALAELETA